MTVKKQISRESQPGLGKKALFIQVEQFLDDACVNWTEFDPRESLLSYYLIKLRETKSSDSCIGLFAGYVMGGFNRATVGKDRPKPNTPALAAPTRSFPDLFKGTIIYEVEEEEGQLLEAVGIVLENAPRKTSAPTKPQAHSENAPVDSSMVTGFKQLLRRYKDDLCWFLTELLMSLAKWGSGGVGFCSVYQKIFGLDGQPSLDVAHWGVFLQLRNFLKGLFVKETKIITPGSTFGFKNF